jgi:hypothetical protein
MRGGSRFTEIANFPCVGSYLVEAGGVTNGPFTNGQSFSFAGFPGGGVAQFSVLPQTNTVLAMLPLQLVFNTPLADFDVQVSAPSLVGIQFRRLGGGAPDSGSGTNVLAYGENVALDAVVGGQCANTYQWWHNGVPLPGETNATLTVSNAVPGLSGRYWVGVTNELGGGAGAATYLVVPPPVVQLANPRVVTNTFQATFSGLPVGAEFVVECSPDLQAWQPVATNTATAADFSFEAPVAATGDAQFYRITVR